jgi:PAS domain S-box-containing protein
MMGFEFFMPAVRRGLQWLALVVAVLVARAADWVPTERLDQPWKVMSLVEEGGLSRLNLFNLDFERNPPGVRQGTVWIASSDGLHEYDGYRWRRHGREQGLPSDFVRCVLVTQAGALWVGTDRGAGLYDGKTFHSAGTETNLAGPNVRRISEDPDGTIWFCSDSWPNAKANGGLTSLRAGQWRAYRQADGLPSGYVVNYFRDRAGRQFAATLGGLAQLQGERWHLAFPLPAGANINWSSSSIAESPVAGLLYSTGQQVFRLQAGAWERQAKEIRHEHGIRALADGTIVAVGRPTRGRSVFMEWHTNHWQPVSAEFATPQGTTEDLREAPDGSVWAVGYDCLVRWVRRGGEWREYTNLPAPKLADTAGGVWFAQTRSLTQPPGPVVRLHAGQWTQLGEAYDELRNNLRSRSQWGWTGNRVTHWQGTNATTFSPAETGLAKVAAGRGDRVGDFWVLGWDAAGQVAASRYASNRWQTQLVPELAGLNLWSAAAGSATNGMWFAGDRGVGTDTVLVRVSATGTLRLDAPATLVGPQRMEFFDDQRGSLWLFGDTGLFRWQLGQATTWESIQELPARQVVSCVQRDDELWFGCSGSIGGSSALVRLRDGIWTTFPVPTLGNLMQGTDSTIFATGTGQIFRVDHQPDAVPVAQFLPTTEAVQAIVRGAAGSLWLGVGDRVLHFQPGRYIPGTRLTGPNRVHVHDPLVVVASEVERFQPRNSQHNARFSWRLDGGGWSEATAAGERQWSVDDLRIGRHRLEVRSVNFEGKVDLTPAVLDFHVQSVPLQERRWFVPGLLVLIGVMTALVLATANARRRLTDYARTLETKVADRTEALEADVKRRQRVEEKLRLTEERFAKAFHASPILASIGNYSDHRILDVNRHFCEVLGYTREELIGRLSPDFKFWADRGQREVVLGQLARWENVTNAQVRVRTRDGQFRELILSAVRVDLSGNDALVFYGVDVTERLRVEEKLRFHEAMLRETGAIAKVGGWAFEVPSGAVFWTDEVARIHGMNSADSATLADGLACYFGENRTRLEAAIQRAITQAEPYDLELEMVSRAGQKKWVRIIGLPLLENDQVTRVRGSFQDITERKLAEAALRESEERFAKTFQASPVAIVISTYPDGVYLDVNEQFSRMFGYSREEVLGRRATGMGIWVDLTQRTELVRRLGAGESIRDSECQLRTKAGEIRVVSTAIERVMLGDQPCMLFINHDITARKQAAESLRQSEATLSAIFSGIYDGVIVADVETRRFVRVNQAMCQMLGYPEEELLDLRVDYIHPADARPAVVAGFLRQAAGQETSAPNTPMLRKDGSVFYADLSLTCIELAGRPCLAGVFRDATERRASEAVLREQLRLQNRLAAMAAAMPGALFVFRVAPDGAMCFTEASPQFFELMGVRPEDVSTDAAPAFARIHPDDWPRVQALIEQVIREDQPWGDSFRVCHPTKGVIWLEGRSHPTGGGGGDRSWTGVLLDVTEKRRAEIRRATEHAVTQVLAEASAMDSATPDVLRALCVGEGWEWGELWSVDGGDGSLTCHATWHRPGEGLAAFDAETRALHVLPGQGIPGRVWQSGHLLIVPSLADEATFLRTPTALAAGLRSLIAFPIRAAGKVIGVMAGLSASPIVADPSLLEMVEVIGSQVGQFIARKTVQEEMKRFVALSPAVLYALRLTAQGLRCYWVSDNLYNLTGFLPSESIHGAWWVDSLHPDDRSRVLAANPRLYEIDHQVLEFRFRRKDGAYIWLRDEKRLLRAGDGKPTEIIGAWTDITDRIGLEKELRQAQKMEAIGLLSGGIAHDFNNILGAIIGNAQIAEMDVGPNHPAAESLGQILKASRRATHLVRQILTFARQDTHELHRVELRPIIEESVRLLRATIPAGIGLKLTFGHHLPAVLADENQIQQVILNLGTNSWHALEGRSGRISIELTALEVDAELAGQNPDFRPGPYVRLRVQDSGKGMDGAMLHRAFDPFFTTKEPGKGTGLGLSVVHGIMKSHRGAILVKSAPGVGTTFDLFLPASPELPSPGAVANLGGQLRRGQGQRLLVIDDEQPILRATGLVLERLGYQVTTCADGSAGLAALRAELAAWSLVLCDFNMPGISGVEVARECASLRPELPVVLSSGYLSEEVRQAAEAAGVRGVVRKPATLEELSEAIFQQLHPVS